MEYGIIKALCWYRIVAAIFAAAVVGFTFEKIAYPTFTVMASGALIVIAITIQQVSRRDPKILMSSTFVVSELTFSVVITLWGGLFYSQGTTSSTLAFASQYILASVLMAGVAFGMSGGIIAGIVIGLARMGAMVINGNELTASRSLSLLSTTVTFCLAGALVGGVVTILRRAGGELSQARARDSIARTLHDGVLQTLVIIQKRAKEEEIKELAGNQEKQLRAFLFSNQSQNSNTVVELHSALDEVVSKFEKFSNLPVAIVISPDLDELERSNIKALCGACLECLTNAAKHANATSINIFVEPSDLGVCLTIRDDGKGFNPEEVLAGDTINESPKHQGLRNSVVQRIEEIDGRVTIKSSQSKGTEVEIDIPVSSKGKMTKEKS